MSGRGGSEGTGGQPPAGADLRWDTSAARTQACDVANAAAGPTDVALTFGATEITGPTGDELAVRLRRRIVLPPLTARNLRDMLRNLIADADARRTGQRP
jgi:hypothetical protein